MGAKHASLPPWLRLDGKIALVTGGSGLLGSAFCRALAEAGATAVTASRRLAECEAVAAAIREHGGKADAIQLDLSDEGSIAEACARVLERHGRIDILINNAVYKPLHGSLPDVATAEDFSAALHVDGTGLMLICKALARPMMEQRSGNIINIASIHGLLGPNFGVPEECRPRTPASYPYVKAAAIGWTLNLAGYYAPHGIRVNCIVPGGFRGKTPAPGTAPLLHRYFDDYTPLGRMGLPAELKGVAVWLCSGASSYVAGAVIPVDGGWSAW